MRDKKVISDCRLFTQLKCLCRPYPRRSFGDWSWLTHLWPSGRFLPTRSGQKRPLL